MKGKQKLIFKFATLNDKSIFMNKKTIITFASLFLSLNALMAQSAMQNPYGRESISLNGQWQALPDWSCNGEYRKIWEEKKPTGKTDFYEYSFDGTQKIVVPGDFNSQIDQMKYSECWVWYKTSIPAQKLKNASNRLFLYFGGINYKADIWLNGEHVGSHEGGYTPFQIEITDKLTGAENSLVVRADNRRSPEGVPAEGFDWFNYGGITRDVFLIETPPTYIEDYTIRLADDMSIQGEIWLNGDSYDDKIKIEIPELDFHAVLKPDESGRILFSFHPKDIEVWSPSNPKLYDIILSTNAGERITDRVGFRTIKTDGNKILLNGQEIFLKAVNIHEETVHKQSRATSQEDAATLLSYAKELGCNMVRLAHYPHNEHTVHLAEEMGLMVWDEIPVYQGIAFDNESVTNKIEEMMAEMVKRDKNRCGVIVWSLSNETWDSSPNRTSFLASLSDKCRAIDNTRLITHVINSQSYQNNQLRLWDPLYEACDLLCINEYIGWYIPWQGQACDLTWDIPADKPVFISEFGGESKYNSNFGPKDAAGYWSEEYQADIYTKQIEMFDTTRKNQAHAAHDSSIPSVNLAGVCPWILFDYLSLGRMHPVYQNGFNRKGLVDENGNRKKAFFIMQNYYKHLSAPGN